MLSSVLILCLVCVCLAARVPEPPTMVKQPPYVKLFEVTETDELELFPTPVFLSCEASGNPEPTYSWKKNGEDFNYESHDGISRQPRRGTLVFRKLDPTDEGVYQCFARNIHGVSASNTVFLRKSELNSFPSQEPTEIHAFEGQPLTLNCIPPAGYPKPVVNWIIMSNTAMRTFKSPRITVDPEGNLHFAHVALRDALRDAMYACTASSFFSYKFGNLIILKVDKASNSPAQYYYPPVMQYASPRNIAALRGEQLRLDCIFGGNPVPEVVWRKVNGSLASKGLKDVNFGKTLVFKSVDLQDGGTYECSANNGQGEPQTYTMHVKIESAPYWIKSSNSTNASEEESVTFECISGGIPEPNLQWFVNGEPIGEAAENPRRRVEGNALTIENLTTADTAVYQCNASNIHGYVFKNFYLNVLAIPPTIIEAPTPEQNAVENSTVILRCRIFGAPKPKVKWMKGRDELTGDRFQVLENGDLRISDVAYVDQGVYTCYSSNKHGDAEVQGTILVKEKTIITRPPENLEAVASKSATFRCEASTDPSLTLKIEWLFNGSPIDFDNDPRMVQSIDNSLTIVRTMELDSGIYTCVAISELEEDREEATLTVIDIPNPPKMVGINCNDLTALVQWQPMGDNRAPILSYTLQFNTTFSPDIWEDASASIPATATSYKVIMSPWANYTFRVIARNKVGPSPPSGVSSMCTTFEDVPYKNPSNVTGRGTTPTNLVISWTVMPLIEHNAPELFYRVYWRRNIHGTTWETKVYWRRNIHGTTWETKDIIDWQQHELVIENQPTFSEYRIRVAAFNRKGQANVYPTDIIGYSGEDGQLHQSPLQFLLSLIPTEHRFELASTPPDAVPTEAPQNFTFLTFKDAYSAVFSWNPVSPNSIRGYFRGYKIQARMPDLQEEYLEEAIVSPNVTESLVNIFLPYTRYHVRIRAFNDMYNGPPSDVVEFITPEATPGPVSSFSGYPMGSTALSLMWAKPLKPNGMLTGYTIHYQEVDGTEIGPLLELQSPIGDHRETHAKLEGLKPSTKYRVAIQATTSQGPGEPVYIETRTEDARDEAPDSPTFVWYLFIDDDGKTGINIHSVNRHPGSYLFADYRTKGTEEWNSTQTAESQDTITIKGLEADMVYEVRIDSVDGRNQTPRIEEIYTGDLSKFMIPHSHNMTLVLFGRLVPVIFG